MAERFLVIDDCQYDGSVIGGIFDTLAEAIICARAESRYEIEVWDGPTLVRRVEPYDFDIRIEESPGVSQSG